MVMTIDIPEAFVKQASELGEPVGDLVLRALRAYQQEPLPEGFVRLGTPTRTPAEATAIIRDIASRNTLNGLSIKDLIEEGRH